MLILGAERCVDPRFRSHSRQLYGAGWMLSSVRWLLWAGVGKARFLSRSGRAGRERNIETGKASPGCRASWRMERTNCAPAFGVRAACCRYGRGRAFESGSKLHALQTLRDSGRCWRIGGGRPEWWFLAKAHDSLAARSRTCVFVAAEVTRLYSAHVIADIRASLPRLLLP